MSRRRVLATVSLIPLVVLAVAAPAEASGVLGTGVGPDVGPDLNPLPSAGDAAKQVVKGLVEDLGFEVFDAGPLAAARRLEPMAMVWIDQVMRYGMDRNCAWALMQRSR